MHALPCSLSLDAFRRWRADASRWLPVVHDIARGHRLAASDLHVFPTGTNLVVALDAIHILKIYPPTLRHQFVSERTSLSWLRGRLSIPIPEIVLEGERDHWPYLILTPVLSIAKRRRGRAPEAEG
jgi:hygromycin-B 7''-O-kinase